MTFENILFNIAIVFNIVVVGLLAHAFLNSNNTASQKYERRPASHYRARPKGMKTNATRFVHPLPEDINEVVLLPERNSKKHKSTSFQMVHRVHQPSGDETISTVSCEERQIFASGTTLSTTPDEVSSGEKGGETIPKSGAFDKRVARFANATKPARKLSGKMIRRLSISTKPQMQNLGDTPAQGSELKRSLSVSSTLPNASPTTPPRPSPLRLETQLISLAK